MASYGENNTQALQKAIRDLAFGVEQVRVSVATADLVTVANIQTVINTFASTVSGTGITITGS